MIHFVHGAVAIAVLSVGAVAQVTTCGSLDSSGTQGNANSYNSAISGNGRFVAYESQATNLVPADLNNVYDIFVHDTQTQATTRVSVDSFGLEGNLWSEYPDISHDGSVVTYQSLSSNLVPADFNGNWDVFVHDRATGLTTRASISFLGVEGNNQSYTPAISDDGTVVAFASDATNLVLGDLNGTTDVFIHELLTGQTILVSVDSAGIQGNGPSREPAISGDGRFVAFTSRANNLVSGDTNNFDDVFVHDRFTLMTLRVSVDGSGNQANATSDRASLSYDGQEVAFDSTASNLVPWDTNGYGDVFLKDLATGAISRISVSSLGAQGINGAGTNASVSGDGTVVAFESYATNLVPLDLNTAPDVFVHDTSTGATTRKSVDSFGAEGNHWSHLPALSADARFISFESHATNLVLVDTNGSIDVFRHGPELILEISPDPVTIGTSVTFDTWRGQANTSGLLYVFAVNGTPFIYNIPTATKFDATGFWTFPSGVPNDPVLVGLQIDLAAFGRGSVSGKIRLSNVEDLTIQ